MEDLKLDVRTTALVLIDLQHGIVGLPLAPRDGNAVVAQAVALAGRFRQLGGTVVLVRVANAPDGGDTLAPVTDAAPAPVAQRPKAWSTIVPELGPVESDIVITKRQWGAFYGTGLDLQLRRRGIGTIVLAGIATHVGVESTARDAYERGYQQVFVEDALASPSLEAHAATLKFTFPRLGRIRSTSAVLAALPVGR